MLELGIDEITLILRPSYSYKSLLSPLDWQDAAESIRTTFEDKADFIEIFGDCRPTCEVARGYTTGFTYGEHSFYICIAYHDSRMDMGVAVKFSAQAFAYYCDASGLKAYSFLQKIQADIYTLRLSRIDLVADYIDLDLNVTDIFYDYSNQKIGSFRRQIATDTKKVSYTKYTYKTRCFMKENEIGTIYFGSSKSNSELRIYDKKTEQLDRFGVYYEKALNCDSWVRFEAVFRDTYAHQITDSLLSIKNDDEFASLIADSILQKYSFLYLDNNKPIKETEFTKELIDSIVNNSFILTSPKPMDYEIVKSLQYLFLGSGMVTTLLKVKEIWGKDASDNLLDFIKEYIDEVEPKADCLKWIIENKDIILAREPDFEELLKNTLYTVL